jgi:hypothetical protein
MYGKKKQEKSKTNDLQSTTQKTKGRETRTPMKIGGDFMYSERISCSCPTTDTHRATPVTIRIPVSFCHCVFCPSSIYGFFLPL